MKEIIIDPQVGTPIRVGVTNKETTGYLIYFFFGLVEVLLAIRLILHLTGASTLSGFVRLVYGIIGIFVLPFQGIFRQSYASGSVLEPPTISSLRAHCQL